MDATPVRIVAGSKANLNDSKIRIWFDGVVARGQPFAIDAGSAGKSRLDANTYVRVFDAGGNELQFVQLHTSCSQDLNVGNQFGSLLLEGFQAEP